MSRTKLYDEANTKLVSAKVNKDRVGCTRA